MFYFYFQFLVYFQVNWVECLISEIGSDTYWMYVGGTPLLNVGHYITVMWDITLLLCGTLHYMYVRTYIMYVGTYISYVCGDIH